VEEVSAAKAADKTGEEVVVEDEADAGKRRV
jgi:hypothetical protein